MKEQEKNQEITQIEENKPQFEYYHSYESEQFAFYRVPKKLFTDSHFKFLSTEAKILYGLMLDRLALSQKNHWIDEQGRVYIIFRLEEAMTLLNCGKDKGIKTMNELDSDKGIGLIERVKQGLGKPDLIYVKNFIIKNITDKVHTLENRKMEIELLQEVDESLNLPDTEVQKSEKPTSGGRKNRSQDFGLTNVKDTNEIQKEMYFGLKMPEIADFEEKTDQNSGWKNESAEVQKSEKPTSGGRKNRSQDFGSINAKDTNETQKEMYFGLKMPEIADFEEKTDQNSGWKIKSAEVQKSEKPTSGGRKNRSQDFGSINAKDTNETQKEMYLGLKMPEIADFEEKTDQNSGWKIKSAEVQKSEKPTSGSRKNRSLEVGRSESIKTNNNKKEENKNNPINPSGVKKQIDAMEVMQTYTEIIKSNIEYDTLIQSCKTQERAYVDEMVELMVEIVSVDRETVLIGGEQYPYQLVKSRFLKVTSDHITYVMESLKANTTNIRNIRSYLLTCIYNATVTINHHYQAKVNHDMYTAV